MKERLQYYFSYRRYQTKSSWNHLYFHFRVICVFIASSACWIFVSKLADLEKNLQNLYLFTCAGPYCIIISDVDFFVVSMLRRAVLLLFHKSCPLGCLYLVLITWRTESYLLYSYNYCEWRNKLWSLYSSVMYIIVESEVLNAKLFHIEDDSWDMYCQCSFSLKAVYQLRWLYFWNHSILNLKVQKIRVINWNTQDIRFHYDS